MVYRDAAGNLQQQITDAAAVQLHRYENDRRVDQRIGDIALAYYLDGHRTGGDADLPEFWPEWLDDRAAQTDDGDSVERLFADVI